MDFFTTSTRNLLRCEKGEGARHHVALSVVGSDRLSESGYFRAKLAQEKLIKGSPVPYSIVHAAPALPAGIAVVTRRKRVMTKLTDIAATGMTGKRRMGKFTKGILVLACLMSSTVGAQEAKVTQLMSKDLTNLPGKEGLMVTVEYPPDGASPIHRHNAHAFIYVLEGSIVMQVRGGKEAILTPGQTFYEGPNDIHVVGRNASQTKPAKFVVFFVKNKGAPLSVPAK